MPKRIDLTAKKIGRFVILEQSNEKKPKSWLCLCDCGTRFIRRQVEIRKGLVHECPNCDFRRSEFYIGGKKFGRLHVLDEWEIREVGTHFHKQRFWKCKCECSNEIWIQQYSITSGKTMSCGCYMQKNNSRYVNETLYPRRAKITTKFNPVYTIWTVLNSKCHNPKYTTYDRWGGNGYTVCEEWRNSSQSFYEWMMSKEWRPKFTIEVKEGEKEFNPKNCFVIPIREYLNKLKKKDDIEKYGIEYQGKKMTLMQWAKELHIQYGTLRSRMQKNNYNFEFCLNDKNFQGSGQIVKREDISDEEIKKLYESGFTIKEIEKKLNFSSVDYRLKKMKVKTRSTVKRICTEYNSVILPLIKEKKTFYEILDEAKKVGRMDKYNLKRKLFDLEVRVKGWEIIYEP